MAYFDQNISNNDIKWQGTYLGLHPSFNENIERIINFIEEPEYPLIIKVLSSADKFVVLHVILTYATRIKYSNFPHWNFLKISIGPDGTVVINPEQRFALQYKWQIWFASVPRPDSLDGE